MIGMKMFDVERIAIEFPGFCGIRKPLRDKMKMYLNREETMKEIN